MALTPDQEYELQLLKQGSQPAPQAKGLTPDQAFELQQLQAMGTQPQDLLRSKQEQAQQIEQTQVSPQLQQAMAQTQPYQPGMMDKVSQLIQSPEAQAFISRQAQGRSLGLAVPAAAGIDTLLQALGVDRGKSVIGPQGFSGALQQRKQAYEEAGKAAPGVAAASSLLSLLGPGAASGLIKKATGLTGNLLSKAPSALRGIAQGVAGGGAGGYAERMGREAELPTFGEVGTEVAKGAATGGLFSAAGQTLGQLGRLGLRGIFKSNELGDFAFQKFKNVRTGKDLLIQSEKLLDSSAKRMDNLLTAERNAGKMVGMPQGFSVDFLEKEVGARLGRTSNGKELNGLLQKMRGQNGQLDLADARRLNTLTKKISNPFKASGDVKDNSVAEDLAKFGGQLRKSIKSKLSKIDQSQFEALNKNMSNSIDIKDTAKIIKNRPIEFNELSRRGVTKAFAPIQALTAARRISGGPVPTAIGETLQSILGFNQ